MNGTDEKEKVEESFEKKMIHIEVVGACGSG
jgi:hypothetical protein